MIIFWLFIGISLIFMYLPFTHHFIVSTTICLNARLTTTTADWERKPNGTKSAFVILFSRKGDKGKNIISKYRLLLRLKRP